MYKKSQNIQFGRSKRPPRNKRPPKTVIFQRGEYTKPMGFDGCFFKGGSTQNQWDLMGDFSKGGSTQNRWTFDGWFFKRGEYTKPMDFWWVIGRKKPILDSSWSEIEEKSRNFEIYYSLSQQLGFATFFHSMFNSCTVDLAKWNKFSVFFFVPKTNPPRIIHLIKMCLTTVRHALEKDNFSQKMAIVLTVSGLKSNLQSRCPFQKRILSKGTNSPRWAFFPIFSHFFPFFPIPFSNFLHWLRILSVDVRLPRMSSPLCSCQSPKPFIIRFQYTFAHRAGNNVSCVRTKPWKRSIKIQVLQMNTWSIDRLIDWS